MQAHNMYYFEILLNIIFMKSTLLLIVIMIFFCRLLGWFQHWVIMNNAALSIHTYKCLGNEIC